MDERLLEKKCPFCNCGFTDEDEVVICSACEMPHHKDCWVENQGCSTYGCTGTIQTYGRSAAETPRLCSNCQSVLDDGAQFCAKCGARATPPPPVPPEQPRFCTRCGTKCEAGAQFCAGCGAPIVPAQPAAPPSAWQQNSVLSGTAFVPAAGPAADAADSKGISALCYLGPLVLIPILMRTQSPFVRFHANQGILCSAFLLVSYFFSTFPIIGFLGVLGLILFGILDIWGIVNCLKGELKQLPLIGKIKIKLFK